MADIRVIWNADTQSADWIIVNGQLDSGADLESSVVLSLFTWARADADDVLPVPGDRKGWHGDLDGEALHGLKRVGSKLWLLSREIQTEQTRGRAVEYATAALAWLINDGVAGRIDVEAEWQARGRLALSVRIFDRDGGALLDRRFDWAWKQLSE
tara:strand:- start:8136 stop:8600 length:465 start_codon:yes stop_codon:yes gene_type:complete